MATKIRDSPIDLRIQIPGYVVPNVGHDDQVPHESSINLSSVGGEGELTTPPDTPTFKNGLKAFKKTILKRYSECLVIHYSVSLYACDVKYF